MRRAGIRRRRAAEALRRTRCSGHYFRRVRLFGNLTHFVGADELVAERSRVGDAPAESYSCFRAPPAACRNRRFGYTLPAALHVRVAETLREITLDETAKAAAVAARTAKAELSERAWQTLCGPT